MSNDSLPDDDVEVALRNAYNATSAGYESITHEGGHSNIVEPTRTRDKLESLLHDVYPTNEEELYQRIDQILVRLSKDKQSLRKSEYINDEALEFLEIAVSELIRAQRHLTSIEQEDNEAATNSN